MGKGDRALSQGRQAFLGGVTLREPPVQWARQAQAGRNRNRESGDPRRQTAAGRREAPESRGQGEASWKRWCLSQVAKNKELVTPREEPSRPPVTSNGGSGAGGGPWSVSSERAHAVPSLH